MRFGYLRFVALFICVFAYPCLGNNIEFKADYYQRDLKTNTTRGRGNAWVKVGEQQLWADVIELNMAKKLAIASGNVRLLQGDHEISASNATLFLQTEVATLEDAVLVSDQMVLSGSLIEKLAKDHFRISEGSYTNCNIHLVSAVNFRRCRADWRIYGKTIEVKLQGYAHIYDAIVYAKELPVFYSPYLVVPAKTVRQSGILTPQVRSTSTLGTGVTVPYFLVLGEWHDITFIPTYYSLTGYHLSTHYRYNYDYGRKGDIKFSFIERRFSGDPSNPALNDPSKSKALGFIGEAAVDAHNIYRFGKRSHSRQIIRLISHPFYNFDYGADVTGSEIGYLRSQIAVTSPSDYLLFTGKLQYHQSMVISEDRGVDKGAPVELPTLELSQSTKSWLGKFLSWEWEVSLSNFYRPQPFDQVPTTPLQQGEQLDLDPSFDTNDYLRTGRRLIVAPRLVVNIPMGTSMQFQPILRTGASLYQFDEPSSDFVHREFVDVEIPFSLYLSKTFETGVAGFEKVKHIFQPRIAYANRFVESLSSNHPFFYSDPVTGLSNPRFDIDDRFSKFEFLRMELINRFYRKTEGGIHRFFRLQVSNSYNLKTFTDDPRFSQRLGPIEVLSEFTIDKFAAQIQGSYDLEATINGQGEAIHESAWSSSLIYYPQPLDSIQLGLLMRTKSERELTEQKAYLNFFKTLPFFFDISGMLEYSLKDGEVISYSTGFHFRGQPRSCWKLVLGTGQNFQKQTFVTFNFQLLFGQLGGAPITLSFQ